MATNQLRIVTTVRRGRKEAAQMYQNRTLTGQLFRGCAYRHPVQLVIKFWRAGVRVLVSGDRGYIGAVLVPLLRAAGHEVHGLDLDLYEGCDLGEGPEDIADRPPIDMREVDARQLVGYDAVLCLAALSNDPLGHLNPAATHSVNLDGTLQLARAAKQAGIERLGIVTVPADDDGKRPPS
jgi:hypothetical protein